MVQYEIMNYQDNKQAVQLGYLALLINTVFLITTLNTVTPNFFIGVKILANILIMLLVLLYSEESKKYQTHAGYKLIGIGALALVRIFWIPLKVIRDPIIEGNVGIYLAIALVAEAALLIISGIITVRKSQGLTAYLQSKEGEEWQA